MEEIQHDLLSSGNDLPITEEASGYLIETSKWAKFIAITFYSVTGAVVLYFIWYMWYIKSKLGAYGGRLTERLSIYVMAMLFAAVVVGFTYYYLLNFANKMRAGIETESLENINDGLRSLKTHLIIVGIILILFTLIKLVQIGN
jgi:hypothetical protein